MTRVRRFLPDLVAWAGIVSVAYGAWLATTPSGWAGWVVFGAACIGVVRFGAEAD